MTGGADTARLPSPIARELQQVATMIFDTFGDCLKGRTSDRYRSGRIVALIAYGNHIGADPLAVDPGAAITMLAIVNHPKLASRRSDWLPVHDRLARAWELGEVAHPVRLDCESLDRINRALMAGIPHFVDVVDQGVMLYRMAGVRLHDPRPMSQADLRSRGCAEFDRWFRRADDFLLGAAFYRTQDNAPMAALLLHQACEHLYQCVLRSITLHGPRTHALDALRESAEAHDARLRAVWPRDTPEDRRAFGCIRRAYVEVRYGGSYRIEPAELDWAMGCAVRLQGLVRQIGGDRLGLPATPPARTHGDREFAHVL